MLQTAHGQVSQNKNEQAAATISSSPQCVKFWANTLEIYISLITSALSLPPCVASDLKMIHPPEEYALLPHCPFLQILNHLQGHTLTSSSGSSSVFASYAFTHISVRITLLISVEESFYCEQLVFFQSTPCCGLSSKSIWARWSYTKFLL